MEVKNFSDSFIELFESLANGAMIDFSATKQNGHTVYFNARNRNGGKSYFIGIRRKPMFEKHLIIEASVWPENDIEISVQVEKKITIINEPDDITGALTKATPYIQRFIQCASEDLKTL